MIVALSYCRGEKFFAPILRPNFSPRFEAKDPPGYADPLFKGVKSEIPLFKGVKSEIPLFKRIKSEIPLFKGGRGDPTAG